MRHFKFEEFENFPLDQTIMKELQGNALLGLEEILRGLGVDHPVVLNGFEVTPLGEGYASVGAGLFWHPDFGFTTFEGAASVVTYPTGDELHYFSFDYVDEDLSFEDGVEPAIQYARAVIGLGSSSVEHWSVTVARKWWHFLGKSAQAGTTEWLPISGDWSGVGEFGEYYHNKASGIVHVRGAKRHFNITGGTGGGDDEPMQMSIGSLPVGARPTGTLYFRTAVETHTRPELRDWMGNIYYGDIGRLTTTGNLSISQRRMLPGSTTDFLHYFEFSYQL